MDYRDLELELRREASAVVEKGGGWSAAEVASKLEEIAFKLSQIRRRQETGINASMGKRSGRKPETL